MNVFLEPGQSVTISQDDGYISKVSGLPAGVGAAFGPGESGLILTASQTPTVGTFNIRVDWFASDPSKTPVDPSAPGPDDPRPPGWHGPWPPPPKPLPHGSYTLVLVVRPPSSEFTLEVEPADRSLGMFVLEQGGATGGLIRIDRTGATYKNTVALSYSLDRPDVQLTPSPLPSVAPDQDQVAIELHNTNAQLGSGGQVHFAASGKVSAPRQPDKQKTVTQDIPLKICPWGDFDIAFSPPPPYTAYRTDKLGIFFTVIKKGEWDNPPQVSLQFSNLPSGVTVQNRPLYTQGFILQAEAGAELGSFPNFTVKVSGFLNGAMKTHEYILPLTVADGFTVALKAASPEVHRGGAPTVITVTVNRLLSFSGEVSLTFPNLPRGLSVSPSPVVIAADRVSCDFALSADCDAALGSMQVWPYATSMLYGGQLFSLEVVDSGFSLEINPSSVTLNA